MLLKTKGIVFRSLKYSETSLILDIFTLEKGLRSYIISGVRKRKSKTKTGILQVSSLVDLVAYNKSDKSLQRIKEIKASHLYKSVPFDVVKSSIATFIVELCRKSIKESEQNEQLFIFIEKWLIHLDSSTHAFSNVPLLFMIQLADQIGFGIHNNKDEKNIYFDLQEGRFVPENEILISHCTIDQSAILSEIMKLQIHNYHEYKVEKAMRMQLIDQMSKFYQWHVENFQTLKTLDVLRNIFS